MRNESYDGALAPAIVSFHDKTYGTHEDKTEACGDEEVGKLERVLLGRDV